MWEEIERNKRKSYLLVGAISALLVIFGYALGEATGYGYFGVIIAAAIALVVSLASYYSGDSLVLTVSRARAITDREAPQLFHVAEEMSIASGLPMPKVYIIEDTAPNAFATGRNPAHASIAVTSGLLSKLSRDELQGVIAHELSHVRNYDILFATLIGVLVGTIAMLSDFVLRGRFIFGPRRRSRVSAGGAGGAGAVYVIIALLLAILAPISAKLLQLAVSRKREYLADASAAELTRYPEGLASALEKIATDQEILEVANRATQHLYIVNPIKPFEERARSLFSTHPPIRERIRRLRQMAGVPIS